MKNDGNGNKLTDIMEVHYTELPKMKKTSTDETDILSIWAAFINNPNSEKVIELESVLEELHEARIELARISRDPKEAEIYRMRENAMNDRANALLGAEEKGLAKGKLEGKMETAKNMLSEGMDVELISKITKLSKEEILDIKNKNWW